MERNQIDCTLWTALRRIAREGPEVFEDAIGEAVDLWKGFLHVDDDAQPLDEFRLALLPKQAPDPGAHVNANMAYDDYPRS